jgi:protoheme IX farnesyltransferase
MKDYLQLTRPGIVIMVLFALAVAAWTTGEESPAWWSVIHAITGTGLITAGSVALNQRIEHRSDAMMARTAERPVPAGRMLPRHAMAFGVLLSLIGLAYLAVFSSRLVAAVAVASWVLYVGLYTPLKAVSVWQTPVGAVAGAMPALIGGTVAGAPLGHMTLSLFAIMFLWQFPHAMAIAWICREQYAAANLRLATVRDPTGRMAGVLAVLGAAALVPASLLPAALVRAPVAFGATATILGAAYLVVAVRFLSRRDDARARQLLWASFVHLPVILLTLLLTA